MKKLKWPFLFFFLLGNITVYNHAYKFTHFSDKGQRIRPEYLSISQKIQVLFMGIDNPRPVNSKTPSTSFETIVIQSKELLEGWFIEKENANGIVLLFHGYSGSKSGNLAYANEFQNLGYSTLLMDFQGSGGSTGNRTTIGAEESEDVKVTFEYIQQRFPGKEIILFGSSMGAVSIMKSIADFGIEPDKIILECPFGSMRTTVQKRFEAMGVPAFPAADLLMFYGSLQHGFNTYKHNPTEFAERIYTPTLLLSGKQDKRVTETEILEIYGNLKGVKKCKQLEGCGHEVYLDCEVEEWREIISEFLAFKI